MSRDIKVHIGKTPRLVGVLRYENQGRRESAAFEYAAEWLSAPDRFTIDPALQLVAGQQFHRRTHEGSVFADAIADAEPDGWARRVILRDHTKRPHGGRGDKAAKTRGLDSMDYLLAVDDTSRVGALRFQDEQGIFQRAYEDERRTTPPLLELADLFAATRAVESNTETAADLAYLRGRGTSLGGLRPKCTVIDDDGYLSIGKFPSVADERAVTKGEVLAMNLAAAAGIQAAAARLVMSDKVPVALIRRFDRTAEGGRIMYVSSATMLGAERMDPADHAYTEIVDAIRRHGAMPQAEIEELWRRIAFYVLINNIDNHLLNHGFLHVGGGQWRLAPAFDINPAPDRIREFKTWISEDTGPAATIEGLMSVIAYFRIAPARAKEILREVQHAVATWRTVAKAIGMTAVELDQFAEAFEHDEREAARKALR
jgi:serine/threonine-protein kinase HipA